MRTPIIITVFNNGNTIRKKLIELNAKFTEKDVLSTFWATQFTVEYPKGKGAQAKTKILLSL